MNYHKIDHWEKLPELSSLLDIHPLPKDLYYTGSWDPSVFAHCTAVVGSRHMTSYGRQVIDQIVPQLVFEGKTIVSGFMYGVDQYAHEVCCENGGKTIAVLGWGIDTPLEGEDQKLAQTIVETDGLLLSQWEHQRATQWTFPVRNKIVVALSQEVIVIEAALKSGSLITADIAVRMKRKLWAVPGPITSKTSLGTNTLIAECDADMWLSPLKKKATMKKTDDPILTLLETEPLSTNEIAKKLNLPISEIGAQLSLFSITGQVIETDGKYSLQ